MPTTNYHTTPYGANLIFNEVVSLHPRALFATPDCISKPADFFAQRYTKPLQLGLKALGALLGCKMGLEPTPASATTRCSTVKLLTTYSNRFLYRVSLFALALDWRYNLRLPYPTLSDSAQVQSAYGLRSKVATILSRLGFAPFAASLNAPSGWCFRRVSNPGHPD